MAKLNNNQINDLLDLELGKEDIKSRINKMKESAREQDSSEGETFSIDKFSYNFRTVSDAEDLKEGTSYSEHMLDLNELMEKGVLQRGNKIDLSDMPEIETIQAATQEQLDMLTPESKKQITAIHLSNNTPVGWDDNYDFDNKSAMDEKLDLSSYHNVIEVQTHFYVNNDLQDIVMPEKATELLCRHSKMENLQKDGGLQDVKVVLDRAQTAFGTDYGYVDPDEEEDILGQLADKYIEEKNEEDFRMYLEEGGKLDDLLKRAIYKGDVVAVDEVLANGANADATVYNYDIHTDESLLSLACMTPFRSGVSYNYDEEGNRHLVESEEVMTYKEIARYLIRAGATDYSNLHKFHDNSLIEETFKIMAPTAEDILKIGKSGNAELLERAEQYCDLQNVEIRNAFKKAKVELQYFGKSEEECYHNEMQEDGTYTTFYKDVPVLKGLLYPAKIEKAPDKDTFMLYESLPDNISYIRLNDKPCVRNEDKVYAVENQKDLIRNIKDVTLFNLADGGRIHTLAINARGKYGDKTLRFDREFGLIKRTDQDGFFSEKLMLYAKNNSKYFVYDADIPGEYIKEDGLPLFVYKRYLEQAKKENFNVPSKYIERMEELVKIGLRRSGEEDNIKLAMHKAKIEDAQKHRDELLGIKADDKTAASPKQANQTTLSVQDMKNAKSDLVK